MGSSSSFDYFYGGESNLFSFYRIPRRLITDPQFKGLSADAKLLYGLFLDRMGLSAKNGWYDPQSRVYIYYTLEEIQADLNCGHDKATRLLLELDTGKGCGLIERIKQGQGRPTKIYVKRFTTREIPAPPSPDSPGLRVSDSPDCGKAAVQTAEKPQSRVRGSRSQECAKTAGSYIESNQTDESYTDLSIYPPSPPPSSGWIDRYDCRRKIESMIGYDALCGKYGRDETDEVTALITDVFCTSRTAFRIGGEDLPIAQVKERFSKLTFEHLEYVFDCMRRNTTEIRNIRAYLLTALYNAPVTINSFYHAAVQHDFSQ